MGIYTAHWNLYRARSRKALLHWLLLFAVGLPLTGAVALGGMALTGRYPFHLHVASLLAWLVVFTVLAVRSARVDCPRCNTRYSRGRGLCNCPKCGLRLLQEDP